MMGFLVRVGNFINSEITGTPTKSLHGVLFARDVTERLKRSSEAISRVKIYKKSTQKTHQIYAPTTLEITFKNIGFEEDAVRNFLEKRIKHHLVTDKLISKHIHEQAEQPLDYTLSKTRRHAYVASIDTLGIPRHPVQLYESIAYLLALVLHLYWWRQRYKVLKNGIIAGSAMITCYSLRFIGEFLKEPFNVLFKNGVTLTTGHLLSLLTVLGGIALCTYSHMVPAKTASKNTVNVRS
mmetsp:Transcript_10491/g.24308  ORF Transcript_10491/g.24308 Transcript_10491/m.24308 type:complete len:238 (+) Transcript_10491:1298-2011(+)